MSEHEVETHENGPTVEAFVEWVEATMAEIESVDRSANMHWCSKWWAHPEAMKRLRALHEEWLLRLVDGGMSSWWTDHFDAHAKVLFARSGPFGECATSHTERGARRTLGCEHPPGNWSW